MSTVNRRLLLAAACGASLLHASRFLHLADDAYISFRYAENLASGEGMVFNPGERVEGYTDFLWVVLLAACRYAGLALPAAAQVLGAGLTCGVLLAAAAVARRIGREPGAAVAGVLAAVLLAASPAVARWAAGGLEAPLFALLALLGAILWDSDRNSPGLPWRWPLALVLAALTRPDGILLFGVALAAFLVEGGTRGAELRRRLAAPAVFLALGLPYFLWRTWYYGALLPNTFHAKVALDGAVLGHGLYYIQYFLLRSGGGVLLIGALAALRGSGPLERLLVGQAFAYTAYVILIGGDGEPYSRYLVPVAALLAPVAAAGLVRMARAMAGRIAPRARGAAAALACLLAAWAMAWGSFAGVHHQDYLRGVEGQERRRAVGEWLAANAPPGSTLALNPVGLIPYLSGLRTIDMLGLTDAHIGRQGRRVTNRVLFAHNRFDPDYVLARRPDYLILGQGSTLEVREHLADLRRPGPSTFDVVAPAVDRYFEAFPGDAILWASPLFRSLYVPTVVETGGRYFYLFVLDRRMAELEERLRREGSLPGPEREERERRLAARGAGGSAPGPPASPATGAAPGRATLAQALLQAEAARATGDLEGARAALEAGLGIDPAEPVLLFNLGVVYEELSRPAEAAAFYERAVATRPGFADALNNLGTLHARRGDLEAARRCWERAVSADPSHPAAANLRLLQEQAGPRP